MAGLKLWAPLLLSLVFYAESKVAWQHVKTTWKAPYSASVCTNKSEEVITILNCTVRTEGHRLSDCKLVYYHGEDLENNCDSNFRITMENQTVFLHLSNLRPEDGGIFTCHCSRTDGTFRLHINVTVEEDETASSSSEALFPCVVSGVIILIIISGLILICRKTCTRRQQEAPTQPPDVQPEDITPYSTFTQTQHELYSVIGFSSLQTSTSGFPVDFTD